MTNQILTEAFVARGSLSDAQFDDENLIVKNAALTFHESRNGKGRLYTETAMSDLAKHSEGSIVYDDAHISNTRPEHSNLCEIAEIKNVRRDGKYNRGDVHLYPEHDKAKLLFRLLKQDKASYALSHEAIGCKTKGGGRKRLDVLSVNSIKGFIITKSPGTTSTITETLDDDMGALTLKDLKDDHVETYDALLEEATTVAETNLADKVGKSEGEKELLKKNLKLEVLNDQLQAKVDTLEKEKSDALAAEKLETETKAAEDKVKKAAEKEGKQLKESLLKTFIKANSDELEDLSEEVVTEFVTELPLLADSNEEPGKKPKSKSGSTKTSKTNSQRRSFAGRLRASARK